MLTKTGIYFFVSVGLLALSYFSWIILKKKYKKKEIYKESFSVSINEQLLQKAKQNFKKNKMMTWILNQIDTSMDDWKIKIDPEEWSKGLKERLGQFYKGKDYEYSILVKFENNDLTETWYRSKDDEKSVQFVKPSSFGTIN